MYGKFAHDLYPSAPRQAQKNTLQLRKKKKEGVFLHLLTDSGTKVIKMSLLILYVYFLLLVLSNQCGEVGVLNDICRISFVIISLDLKNVVDLLELNCNLIEFG